MNKYLFIALLSILALGTIAHAAVTNPFKIYEGGTGTSTAPAYGQLLIGDSNGNYEFVASSTFGGGGGTTYTGTYPILVTGTVISTVATSSLNLTVGTFLSNNISQWNNNSNYITSAGAPVQSVSNSDSTLTISPTTGTVVASLNLVNPNTWSGAQTFNNITINGTCTGSGCANVSNYFSNSGNLTTLSTGYQLSVPTNGWFSEGSQLLAYAFSTNQDTIFGLGAGGQNATTSATVNSITAFGWQAGSALTTGQFVTAVGAKALIKATGSYNTSVGYASQQNLTSGTANTAVGYVSGNSGTGNNAFGFQALQNVTGSQNIGIGYQAGNAISSGSDNIAIGHNVNVLSATLNQQLNIGNIIYGTGLYNGSSLSSYPTANGNIGIGTTTPLAKLSVHMNTGDTDAYSFLIATSSATATTSAYQIDKNGNHLIQNGAGLDIGNNFTPTGSNLTVAGNVGVSTTSPSAVLSIAGLAGGTKPLFMLSTSTSLYATTTAFEIDNNGQVIVNNSIPYYGTGANTAIVCYMSNGALGHITITSLLASGSCVGN